MTTLFAKPALRRSILTDAAAAQFREQAAHRLYVDPQTGGSVVLYVHPDGRVLVDSIEPGPSTP